MKQTTSKLHSEWLARCRESHCHEQRVKCPVCKHFGHVTTHVQGDNTDYIVRVTIQHSHFVENQDGGRNMYCKTNFAEKASADQIRDTWRLTNEGRRDIINHYAMILGPKKRNKK